MMLNNNEQDRDKYSLAPMSREQVLGLADAIRQPKKQTSVYNRPSGYTATSESHQGEPVFKHRDLDANPQAVQFAGEASFRPRELFSTYESWKRWLSAIILLAVLMVAGREVSTAEAEELYQEDRAVELFVEDLGAIAEALAYDDGGDEDGREAQTETPDFVIGKNVTLRDLSGEVLVDQDTFDRNHAKLIGKVVLPTGTPLEELGGRIWLVMEDSHGIQVLVKDGAVENPNGSNVSTDQLSDTILFVFNGTEFVAEMPVAVPAGTPPATPDNGEGTPPAPKTEYELDLTKLTPEQNQVFERINLDNLSADQETLLYSVNFETLTLDQTEMVIDTINTVPAELLAEVLANGGGFDFVRVGLSWQDGSEDFVDRTKTLIWRESSPEIITWEMSDLGSPENGCTVTFESPQSGATTSDRLVFGVRPAFQFGYDFERQAWAEFNTPMNNRFPNSCAPDTGRFKSIRVTLMDDAGSTEGLYATPTYDVAAPWISDTVVDDTLIITLNLVNFSPSNDANGTRDIFSHIALVLNKYEENLASYGNLLQVRGLSDLINGVPFANTREFLAENDPESVFSGDTIWNYTRWADKTREERGFSEDDDTWGWHAGERP